MEIEIFLLKLIIYAIIGRLKNKGYRLALNFEWDDKKAKSNLIKHKISFEEASTAFSDNLSITIEDPMHSENENRLILIGESISNKTLIVVHVEQTDSIRIISARKATKKEQKFYEES